MIREFGESVRNATLETIGRAAARFQEERPLPVDLLESDDAYLAVFDAPGVDRRDVQVRYSDNAVSIRVDRTREYHEGFEMRSPGRGLALDGEVDLPEGAWVDPEAATAKLTESGELHVHIPKIETGAGAGAGDLGTTEMAGTESGRPDAGTDVGGTTTPDSSTDTGAGSATDVGADEGPFEVDTGEDGGVDTDAEGATRDDHGE